MTNTTCLAVIDTSIGTLVLHAEGEYLTRIELPTPARVATARDGDATNVLHDAATQLTQYLAGERLSFDVPVRLNGTHFQRAVWGELMKIPYGETITYSDLAHRVDSPKGFRAVGQANGRNPIPIIVPCHRVVASNGIGGYAGGVNMKLTLLELEQQVTTRGVSISSSVHGRHSASATLDSRCTNQYRGGIVRRTYEPVS